MPKESFYDDADVRFILKNRTGILISLDQRGASITGQIEEHTNQVVNLIGTLFGLSLVARGYAMLHGSAIVDHETGTAIAFLGNSGSGKSSLALQLIERSGYEFLSNDRVLLCAEGDGVNVVGLPKKPRVNPGTLLASPALSRLVPRPRRRAYARLPAEDLWQLEEKTDVDVEEDLGARSTMSAPLACVYSLDWRRTGEGLEETQLGVDAAINAMRVTAKDFGPYDLRNAPLDAESELQLIAERVPFTSVTGKSDPRGFAERW